MLVIKESCTINYEVKKSKFITTSFYIESLSEIKPIIQKLKKEHPNAAHVVHCAVVGKDGNEFSYSDDKEPKNTSGRPSFDVLKGSKITNVLVTTIRYFGGTLLGTGGLVNAYSTCVKELLKVQKTKPLLKTVSVEFTLPYNFIKPITLICEKYKADYKFEYEKDVKALITIEENLFKKFSKEITEFSKGSILL